MHPTRFGIQSGQQLIEWADMLALWQRADAWGYHSLWNFDHFYPIFVDPEGPCLEGWTTLSALAQATTRARIGTLVNGNTYRHPSLTANAAASLDHISGGRLNLGLGAGWFELEHQQLGFDFKTVGGRLAALDDELVLRDTRDRVPVRERDRVVLLGPAEAIRLAVGVLEAPAVDAANDLLPELEPMAEAEPAIP